eukprot:2932262-Ditylum_brightwellii.AAC.1
MKVPSSSLATFLLGCIVSSASAFTPSSSLTSRTPSSLVKTPSFYKRTTTLSSSPTSDAENEIVEPVGFGQPTELPDSLQDAAEIAAQSSATFAKYQGGVGMTRCRVDFDTSVGDETYTTLKSSTEFMQKYVSALCYALIPGAMERRQDEMMRLATAQAQLTAMMQDKEGEVDEEKRQELLDIIAEGGRDPKADNTWKGPVARIYFPDEGSAALARRDWNPKGPPTEALVPPCVEFSSCGGVQMQDITNDKIILFFCPKASEAEFVEQILYKTEAKCGENLALTVFVNPLLVDMGVTGFGMAGRMLRERLIDDLTSIYYLRTLQWGALTRIWPNQFTVWQEDEEEEG